MHLSTLQKKFQEILKSKIKLNTKTQSAGKVYIIKHQFTFRNRSNASANITALKV
jgi:hypothetical protein